MKKKNGWILLVFMLCGIVLGGLVGELCKDVSWLWWLDYGKVFGLENPLILDLSVIKIVFGLTLNINICSIIFMFVAILFYRKI